MKRVVILGCSYTEGVELYDPIIFKNYWESKKTDPYWGQSKSRFDESIKHWDMIAEYYKEKGAYTYYDDCRKTSWPTLLQEKIKEFDIYNYSLHGSGLDIIQKMTNTRYIENKNDILYQFITDRPDFRTHLFEDDILIWQLTTEPRYCVSINENHIMGTRVSVMKHKFNKDKNAPSWKKKIALDFYENVFNEKEFLREKLDFFNYVLLKRHLLGKKTYVFSIHTNFHKFGITENDIEKPESVVFLNNIINENYIDKIKTKYNISDKDSVMKYGHMSQDIHDKIAGEIYHLIKEHT